MPVNRLPECGFTLLEAMIVLAIVAVLASIALPSYVSYVKRSRLLEAVTQLADARARMEDYFMDQRTYVDAAGRCGVENRGAAADAFDLRCEGTATTFVYTASGRATKGMSAFVYTIDQTGSKVTVSAPSGWSRPADCWTIRQDGLCV
jgi:type IV pilus assembly protein PilE